MKRTRRPRRNDAAPHYAMSTRATGSLSSICAARGKSGGIATGRGNHRRADLCPVPQAEPRARATSPRPPPTPITASGSSCGTRLSVSFVARRSVKSGMTHIAGCVRHIGDLVLMPIDARLVRDQACRPRRRASGMPKSCCKCRAPASSSGGQEWKSSTAARVPSTSRWSWSGPIMGGR